MWIWKKPEEGHKYILGCLTPGEKVLTDNGLMSVEDVSLTNKLINGPISKTSFLNKKFLGITEYLAKKTKAKQNAMLIYNKRLSVCPITTHLPLKSVTRNITKKI